MAPMVWFLNLLGVLGGSILTAKKPRRQDIQDENQTAKHAKRSKNKISREGAKNNKKNRIKWNRE